MPVKRRIGDVTVSACSHDDALSRIVHAVQGSDAAIFAFCNAHSVNLARRDAAFRDALAQAEVFNDGVGLAVAARLLGQPPFPANLNGTDLTPALLAALPAGTKVFLLGSPAGVADEARVALSARFPALCFVGVEHGWFGPSEEAALVARIRASGADIVLAGMGQPRQEIWAANHAKTLGCTVMCIGAYLDFAAGRFRRAPGWVRAARLEWVFRLALEPRRLANRYLVGNAVFLLGIVRDRLRSASH